MTATCILMREPWEEITPTATMILEVSSTVWSQFPLTSDISLCQPNHMNI